MEKIRDCLRYAVKPLPDGAADRLIAAVGRLEDMEDVSDLIHIVS
jgi:hypothetical protein